MGIVFSRSATESECGFLSNYEEAEKLGTEEYQELIAKGILEGILAYLESNTQVPNTKEPNTTESNTAEPDTAEPKVEY